jgi:hypothetical protein
LLADDHAPDWHPETHPLPPLSSVGGRANFEHGRAIGSGAAALSEFRDGHGVRTVVRIRGAARGFTQRRKRCAGKGDPQGQKVHWCDSVSAEREGAGIGTSLAGRARTIQRFDQRAHGALARRVPPPHNTTVKIVAMADDPRRRFRAAPARLSLSESNEHQGQFTSHSPRPNRRENQRTRVP